MSPNIQTDKSDNIPTLSTNSAKNNSVLGLFSTLIYESSFLEHPSKPLSAILIASAGTGKTLSLTKLRKEKFVYYTNAISSKFLVEFMKKADKGEKTMLVIPDFLVATEGSKNNRENLIKLLRAMTEEGIEDVAYYGYPEIHFDKPANAGLLTSITFDGISEFKHSWKSSGFLSRLIPFSFTLSPVTKDVIEKKIMSQEAYSITGKVPQIRREDINRSYSKVVLPESMAYRLHGIAYKLASITGNISAPFRQEKQMYSLAKAHAHLRHSKIVEEVDIQTILSLANWINLDFNPI